MINPITRQDITGRANIAEIIQEIEGLSKKAENKNVAKGLTILLEHLNLLAKYMKTDGTNYDAAGVHDKSYSHAERVLSQFHIVTKGFMVLLPDYKETIKYEFERALKDEFFSGKPRTTHIKSFFEHCVDLLKISFVGEKEIEDGNIYLGIDEKMKRAGISAAEGNKEGCFSCLHTAMEFLVKDRLGIVVTMNTRLGKVIGTCIENDVFPGNKEILKSLNTKICGIHNNMKHKAYNPTLTEMNDALLIGQQAVRVLKNQTPNLTPELTENIMGLITGKEEK